MAFPWVQAANLLPLGLALLPAVAGCAPSEQPLASPPDPAAAFETAHEIQALRAEVARLAAENARLRLTSPALAADVRLAVAAGDGPKAEAALKRLADHFPYGAELAPARRQVAAFLARLHAAEREAKRLAALGFKGLKARPLFSYKETELRVADVGLMRRWVFDSYGRGWRYLDAEKGQRLLVADVTVTSRSKDPALFGLGAYVADGATLTQVGSFRYRFVRWLDFGALLGNHADFRNDFGHSERIPFSAGAAVSQEDSRRRPLYLVATREGCHKRRQDRLLQPPIHYVLESCASLKQTLTVEDFKDGSLAVVKRID